MLFVQHVMSVISHRNYTQSAPSKLPGYTAQGTMIKLRNVDLGIHYLSLINKWRQIHILKLRNVDLGKHYLSLINKWRQIHILESRVI